MASLLDALKTSVFKKTLTILLLSVIIISCSSTMVIGTWKKSEDQEVKYDKIALLGISHSTVYRKIFEQAVEEQMLNYGYEAEGALDFLPPNENEDNTSPEIVMAFFASAKVDAVMTMHLLEIDDTRHYVPGRAYFIPYYNTYSFYDHYYEVYEYVYSPAYYAGELDVFLEANLFDFETGELIWSAQTETMDLNNINEIANSFAKTLVHNLHKSSVLFSSLKK